MKFLKKCIQVRVNQSACNITGFNRDELIGKNLTELVHPDDIPKVLKKFQEGLSKGETSVETRFIKKNGEIAYWIVKAVRVDENHLIGFTTEITELKSFEHNLIQSKNEAEKANLAKTEFLANMSHEIRTPLNSVIGFTDLLKNTPLNNEQAEYLHNANSSAHLLLDIINDILDFSKIEAGMLTLDKSKTDIHELIQEVIDNALFAISPKKIELISNIDKELPRFAFVDPIRLKQILVNLLNNALKFTEKGKVELEVSFEPKEQEIGMFYFSISDTGIGISKEQQKKLFKSFSQGDSSITRNYGGTGLGLKICSLLGEKMDTKIDLESEPIKGSTFSFKIKTEYQYGEKIVHQEDLDDTIILGMNKKPYFLIAEDNMVNMKLIKLFLKKILPEAKIAEAFDGKEAIKVFQKETPDLILMDLQMPNLDGITATKEIRTLEMKSNTHAIIIALTASATSSERDKCLRAGMDDFLSKPINRNDLKDVLIKYLTSNS